MKVNGIGYKAMSSFAVLALFCGQLWAADGTSPAPKWKEVRSLPDNVLGTARWREGSPVLATCYSMIALEEALKAPPPRANERSDLR